MAKSSDYKTLAKGIAAQWVRARLMADSDLQIALAGALTKAVDRARALERAEIAAKAS